LLLNESEYTACLLLIAPVYVVVSAFNSLPSSSREIGSLEPTLLMQYPEKNLRLNVVVWCV
jgi:hypothetical protein